MNNPWQMVNKHIEPTGYIHESVADKLKRTQEELGRHGKLARARTIKTGVLSLLFGMALGAFGMVYFEQAKTQPVVVEIERSVPGDTAGLEAQIKALNAKIEANYTQQMQRQKEVRFKTDKLELTKQVHDAKLVTAQEGADHIRQMAAELGVALVTKRYVPIWK